MNLTEWSKEIWDEKYDFTTHIKMLGGHKALLEKLAMNFKESTSPTELEFAGTGRDAGVSFIGNVCSVSTHGYNEFNGYFRIRFSDIRVIKKKNSGWKAVLEDKVPLPWSKFTTSMNLPWAKDNNDVKLVRFAVLIVGWNKNILNDGVLGTFRCWPHDFIEHALSCFPYQGKMPPSETR